MFNFFHFSDYNLLKRRNWCDFPLVFAGGALYAAALPPYNLEFLGFITLIPLVYCAVRSHSFWRGALLGWVWSLGWTIFAFQFLREIEPVIPYLLAPVLSLWGAVFGAVLPGLWRYLIFPKKVLDGGYQSEIAHLDRGPDYGRLLLFAASAAALFALLELTRYHLFNWNDLSVTQYKNWPLLQISRYTGSYGINFLVALGNLALFGLLLKRGYRVTLTLASLPLAAMVWGYCSYSAPATSTPNFSPVVIQGDLSQRRRPSVAQVFEAFDIYFKLSREAAAIAPELIIWPESAVPVSYHGAGTLNQLFRMKLLEFQREKSVPMLIGALDYTENLPPGNPVSGVTNSALLFDNTGQLQDKYDKFHRVPYGEYIPFRRFLPQFLTRRIDMGRDLTPGQVLHPLALNDHVRAGVAICYEGVFGYLTREFARNGANVLIVLSNDAWYPKSSEPEQHLANATIRAVETGLPMIRCGNNGGSGVVTPQGKFTQVVEVPGTGDLALRRGRGWRQLHLSLNDYQPTWFVRFGSLPLSLLLLAIFGTGVGLAWRNYWAFHRQFVKK